MMKGNFDFYNWWKKFNRKNTYVLALVVFIITTAIYFILQPAIMEEGVLSRITTSNFRTWLPIILLSVGQTVVMLGGGLDLSSGAILSLGNVILAISIRNTDEAGFNLLIVLAVIMMGLVAGALNGFFVAFLDLQPIIATFATSFLYSGLALLILPQPGGKIPRPYTDFYRTTKFLGIPLAIYIIIAVLLIWVFFRNRKYGRFLYAVGGDEKAAYTTGVPVKGIITSTYILSGLLASMGSISYTLLTGSGSARSGEDMTLTALTAAVIGGTSFSGGSGSLFGTVLGAVILGTIQNILSLARLDSWYRTLVNAVIIVIALAGPGFIRLFAREK